MLYPNGCDREQIRGVYNYAEFNYHYLLRTTLNDHTRLEKLRRAELTREQQERLLGGIDAIFYSAIDIRSPKNRPPGKAGLRAEKSYYRLLYLEGDFHEKVNARAKMDPDAPPNNWEHMIDILRQLTDIPELRSEILAGIESALEEIMVHPRAGD